MKSVNWWKVRSFTALEVMLGNWISFCGRGEALEPTKYLFHYQ